MLRDVRGYLRALQCQCGTDGIDKYMTYVRVKSCHANMDRKREQSLPRALTSLTALNEVQRISVNGRRWVDHTTWYFEDS